MTTQEKLKLVNLIKEVSWQYRLETFTDAALKQLMAALDKAQGEILAQIEAKAADLTEWRENRSLALLDEWSDMQLGIRAHLGASVTDIASLAGAQAFTVHNDVLSFSGMVKDFNNVAMTPNQLRAILHDVPVGGRNLAEWIDSAFGAQKEAIRTEILTGMLKGQGYPGLVRRFSQGWDMSKADATAIARSYTQTINVDAMHQVAKANSQIVRGWRWCSAVENGAFYVKSGKGKGRGICMLCLALDSSKEVYPLDGGPEIPAHVNCRCFRDFVLVSWRELGIPMDEIDVAARPYTIRGKGIDAETGEIVPQSVGTGGRTILDVGHFVGTYEDFFKDQSAMIQKMTIGPRRLELYNSGKVRSLADLVTIEKGRARLLTLKELQ
jgi:hypothetical protein